MNLLLGIVKILEKFSLILLFLLVLVLALFTYMLFYDFLVISFYIKNLEESTFDKLILLLITSLIFILCFISIKKTSTKNAICLSIIIFTLTFSYKQEDYLIIIANNKYNYVKDKIIKKDIDVINSKIYKEFLIDKENLDLTKIKNYMEIENIYSNFERSINENLIGLNNENKEISIKLKDYIIESLDINDLDKKRLLKKYEDNFISEIEFKEIVLEINKIVYSGKGGKNEY